jgi:hypothetical protein
MAGFATIETPRSEVYVLAREFVDLGLRGLLDN